MRVAHVICTVCAILLAGTPVLAGTKSVTCFLDGGRVRQEVTARKGIAEVTLPHDVIAGSLRVRPSAGVVITRVQTVPAKVDPKAGKALAALDDRKDILNDRLKALETREAIFTAAAKSQSGKAPRKSKSNPEPVTAIRQGTDFALTRLEEVYRARRATEKELKELEGRRAELARKANIGGSVARISMQGGNGAVTVEYLVASGAWKPAYDFRLDGTQTVSVTLRAILPEIEQGATVSVVAASLAALQPSPAEAVPVPVPGEYAAVASLSLVASVTAPASAISPLAFTLSGAGNRSLPPGDGTCFWNGEYFGTLAFPGIDPAGKLELVCGRPQAPLAAPPEAKQ